MMLELPMAHLPENVRGFVQSWAEGKVASGREGVMHAMKFPSMTERYVCMDCQWFGQYVSNEVKAVWDCYTAKLGK